MRYQVNAYLCTNYSHLTGTLETDNFYDVQDFVWDNCQNGLNCELIDNERGETRWAYAEDFVEEAETVDELLHDLYLEQCEQM